MVSLRESTVLKFNTSLDKVHSVRVNYPCPALSPSRLDMAIGFFIQANPFCPEEVGTIISANRAQNVVQETRVLFTR